MRFDIYKKAVSDTLRKIGSLQNTIRNYRKDEVNVSAGDTPDAAFHVGKGNAILRNLLLSNPNKDTIKVICEVTVSRDSDSIDVGLLGMRIPIPTGNGKYRFTKHHFFRAATPDEPAANLNLTSDMLRRLSYNLIFQPDVTYNFPPLKVKKDKEEQ